MKVDNYQSSGITAMKDNLDYLSKANQHIGPLTQKKIPDPMDFCLIKEVKSRNTELNIAFIRPFTSGSHHVL